MNRSLKISVICFTAQGAMTALRIKEILEFRRARVHIWCKKKDFAGSEKIERLEGPLKRWTGEAFSSSDGLIFIGATGIAVRSIAPFLRSKTTDPAVIAVDEKGSFVISLVSGHIGGANELCEEIARELGAIPVITTATDLNQKFAVDVFARKNGLWISDMKMAKLISAALLDGETVGFSSDFPWTGEVPRELEVTDSRQCFVQTEAEKETVTCLKYGICVSLDGKKKVFPNTLHLLPRIAVLGIGCRKGKSMEELDVFVTELLEKEGISIKAVEKVCSIDVKAEEEGVLRFCEKYGLPFETYSAEQLKQTQGSFSASAFVSGQVGVDNVCERSAVLGSKDGNLLIKKTACSGMTAAVALREWRAHFE